MKPGCVGRAISVGVAREMESRAGPRPDMFDDNAPTAPDFRSPARLPRSSPPESGDKGGDALIDGDERTGSATTKGELTRISGHIMTEELIGESKPAASSLDIQHASRHDFSEVSTGKDPEPPVTTSRRARRIKLKPLKEPGPRNLKAAVANTEMIWPVDAHSFASAKLSSEASERRTGSDGRLPVTVRGASPLRGASPGRRAAWSMDSVK